MALWQPRFKSRLHRLRRYRHIMAVLMRYGLEDVAAALRSKISVRLGEKAAPVRVRAEVEERSRPERFRLVLEELGPTFIKFGQLLSTRPDLLSPEYIHELERLQDRVPPADPQAIREELEQQLQGPLDEVFRDFDPEPLAAASIAQVYRARTKEGLPVAIKARRPGIVDIMETEREIIEDIAGILQTTLFKHETIDLQEMVHEFGDAIVRETNFTNERRNQSRFIAAFEDDVGIHIPRIYKDYCTEGVLTMEYIDGIKPGDREEVAARGFDPKVVGERAANFVFTQIFELGFFHADPHPGNFFLLPDNVLAPIDFGQVASLSSRDKWLFDQIVMAVVTNDGQRIVDALERQNMIHEDTDVTKLTVDIEQIVGAYWNLPLKEIPFRIVIHKVFDVFRIHHVHPPSAFVLTLKSLMTIENFARSMDPEFNIVEALRPYARRSAMRNIEPKHVFHQVRKVVEDAGDLASRIPKDLNAILARARQGKFQIRVQHEHLEALTRTLDKSSNRISFALIITGLLVGSSMLVAQESLREVGFVGYIIAAIFGLWLLISIMRGGRL